eukprot:4177137-Pyramimonas_sp.AAC.1
MGPPCGYMPSPLALLVHPAGICPLPSSDWSLLRGPGVEAEGDGLARSPARHRAVRAQVAAARPASWRPAGCRARWRPAGGPRLGAGRAGAARGGAGGRRADTWRARGSWRRPPALRVPRGGQGAGGCY